MLNLWSLKLYNVADIIWHGQGVQQLHVPRVAGEHGAGRHPGHHLRLHLRPGRAPARCPGGGRGGGGARADRAASQDQEVRHWQWHSSCSGLFNKMHAQSINEIFHNWAKHFDYICYHWQFPWQYDAHTAMISPVFACTAHAMLVNQIIVSNIFSQVSPECECCSCQQVGLEGDPGGHHGGRHPAPHPGVRPLRGPLRVQQEVGGKYTLSTITWAQCCVNCTFQTLIEKFLQCFHQKNF